LASKHKTEADNLLQLVSTLITIVLLLSAQAMIAGQQIPAVEAGNANASANVLNSNQSTVNTLLESGIIDVRYVGITATTGPTPVDNAPHVTALMNAVSTNNSGGHILLAGTPRAPTWYYFSTGLIISRPSLMVDCGGSAGRHSGVNIIVPAGVDGVYVSGLPGASSGLNSELRGCSIISLGSGTASTIAGSSSVTDLAINRPVGYPAIPTPWTSGDGIIVVSSYMATWNSESQTYENLTVSPGAYLASVSGSTGTLHAGFTAMLTGTRQLAIRLPADLACMASYTSGSPHIGLNCPFLATPGSLVWTDAFPLKSWILSAAGRKGNQIATISSTGADSSATASYTGGGRLWVIPAGIHFTTTGYAEHNYVNGFGAGILALCSSAGKLNCTGMAHRANVIEGNLWGRYYSGNNTGGGSVQGTTFIHDFINDSLDDGTIGNMYSGESYNSSETDAINAVQGNCANQNASSYVGDYYSSSRALPLFCDRGLLNTPTWLAPQYGAPSDVFVYGGGGSNLAGGNGYFFGYTVYENNNERPSTVGSVGNQVIFGSFVLPFPKQISLAIAEVVVGSSGATCDVGLYNAHGSLVAHTQGFSAVSAGFKVAPLTRATMLSPGVYYQASTCSSQSVHLQGFGNVNTGWERNVNGGPVMGYCKNSAKSGVLPSTCGGFSSSAEVVTKVMYK
jgi:hypothetical protein